MSTEIKPYLLIEFIQQGQAQAGQKASIDIIPSSWALCDLKGNYSCKFMKPPYSKDDLDSLAGFVKQRADAPSDWPLYPITVKDHAGMH